MIIISIVLVITAVESAVLRSPMSTAAYIIERVGTMDHSDTQTVIFIAHFQYEFSVYIHFIYLS